MLKPTQLRQIEISEQDARKIISMGINQTAKFFIMNSKKNIYEELSPGIIQEIQNAHPNKIRINLEPFKPVIYKGFQNAAHHQMINYLDLWANEVTHKKIQQIINNDFESLHDIDLNNSPYFCNFRKMTEEAIYEYPKWIKSLGKNHKVNRTDDLTNWIKEITGADSREAEIIKKILSDFFK